jgi:glycosyltransferase involved in cell wall biosynthesis
VSEIKGQTTEDRRQKSEVRRGESVLRRIRDQRFATANPSVGGSEIRGSPRRIRPLADQKAEVRGQWSVVSGQTPSVALLTGGSDRPYALGIAAALTADGIWVDFIGSDELDLPELQNNPRVRFLNLRGDQRPQASRVAKGLRVLRYYLRLICYTGTAEPQILHILWNNKFELFDRTFLMLYYRLMGKRLVLTAHNVNARKRDASDSFLNRLSLRVQYRLSDHIFVHTERMKRELLSDFGIQERKVSVIPFGINNTVPNTVLTSAEAKGRLGLTADQKAILFFGNIAPYKGLEFLVEAMTLLVQNGPEYRLVIAGRLKNCAPYWDEIQRRINRAGLGDCVIERIQFIPDQETEVFFKAADVLALPYTHIFQSGVLFLGYSFGLPAIAADVGSLKDEIIEGKTGLVCKPRDSSDLANTIAKYFGSDLYRNLESRRPEIKEYANDRYSWDKVAAITTAVYSALLHSTEDRGRKAEDR